MDIEDLLIKHECVGGQPNTMPYKDTKGIDTIGIGHNMVASPLPSGWTFPLTRMQVDQLFQAYLLSVMKSLTFGLLWFTDLDDVRKSVLIDMCFIMGWGALEKFAITLHFIGQGNYTAASKEMLNSDWAKELPSRSREDSQMMLLGLWPDDPNFIK